MTNTYESEECPVKLLSAGQASFQLLVLCLDYPNGGISGKDRI